MTPDGASSSRGAGKYLLLHRRGGDRLRQGPGGTSRPRPTTTSDRPLVGDGHRHREVHRLRQLRARLQGGERRPARAVLLPHLGRALPRRRRTTSSIPSVDSPNGGYDGFPETLPRRRRLKSFFVPKLCNHCARLALRAGLPGGRDVREPRRRRAGRQGATASAAATACRPAPTAAASSTRARNTVDKCTLCYHRITKGLTTACCEACPTGARQLVDLKNPKDPVHEFLRTHKVQVLKPQMATGAKVYYNGLDGSVR